MTEYDKIVLLAASPMLIAIVIGMVWDLIEWIRRIYEKCIDHKHTK
jgi:hypothetical protein